jgi:hypothetical protein
MTDYTKMANEMAKRIAEAMNGGKFDEPEWYNETAKKNWQAACEPYASAIRALNLGTTLRDARIAQLEGQLLDLRLEIGEE